MTENSENYFSLTNKNKIFFVTLCASNLSAKSVGIIKQLFNHNTQTHITERSI